MTKITSLTRITNHAVFFYCSILCLMPDINFENTVCPQRIHNSKTNSNKVTLCNNKKSAKATIRIQNIFLFCYWESKAREVKQLQYLIYTQVSVSKMMNFFGKKKKDVPNTTVSATSASKPSDAQTTIVKLRESITNQDKRSVALLCVTFSMKNICYF